MRFSIITISYNVEDEIEKTILSVLNQTYVNYEYILVDGQSKDSTNDIIVRYLDAFEKKGIPVKYISERDEGISDAFNKGIGLAEGEIVGIINAGDLLCRDTLDKVHTMIHGDSDVIYGNVIWCNSKKNYQYVRKSKSNLKNLMYNMEIMHPATFVRLNAYKRIGMFNLNYRYCMDQELLARMQLKGVKFQYIDEELAIMNSGGISDTNAWLVLCEAARIPKSLDKDVATWKIDVILILKYVKDRLARLYRNVKKGKYLQMSK